MRRSIRTWILAASWLVSCLLVSTADAQTSRRVNSRRSANNRPTQARQVSRERDLFEVNTSSYFEQDENAPPAPENFDIQGAPSGGEFIAPGESRFAPGEPWADGPYHDHGYDRCGCGGYGEYGCGSGCNNYGCCSTTCGYFRWWENLSVFTGVQGFRGPVDFGANSNFGFNQGVNFSMGLFPEHCIGAQVGFRTTQTNLEGNIINGEDASRDQAFLTAGLFRRAGWLRGGAVIDIMNDEYYADFDLNQIRAEMSMMLARGGEFGVWTAVSGDRDESYIQQGNFNTVWSPVDQFAFFYRREFCNGGNIRAWGGFTGHSDSIFGSELLLPFSNRLAVATSFNYLIPDESALNSYEQESWNIGINFVWYPGGRNSCGDCGAGGLYDAMFRVADNGTFFVNRRDRQNINVD
mgnify:FL=1